MPPFRRQNTQTCLKNESLDVTLATEGTALPENTRGSTTEQKSVVELNHELLLWFTTAEAERGVNFLEPQHGLMEQVSNLVFLTKKMTSNQGFGAEVQDQVQTQSHLLVLGFVLEVQKILKQDVSRDGLQTHPEASLTARGESPT